MIYIYSAIFLNKKYITNHYNYIEYAEKSNKQKR